MCKEIRELEILFVVLGVSVALLIAMVAREHFKNKGVKNDQGA